MKGRAATAASLPMCWPLPLRALERAPAGEGSCIPGRCLLLTPLWWALLLCGILGSACVWPTCRGGAETTAEPRGCTTKEEELKSLLMAVQTTDLHARNQLSKLSTCRISEQTMSAPRAETGLASAAVDFVGTYTWGLGQARV